MVGYSIDDGYELMDYENFEDDQNLFDDGCLLLLDFDFDYELDYYYYEGGYDEKWMLTKMVKICPLLAGLVFECWRWGYYLKYWNWFR